MLCQIKNIINYIAGDTCIWKNSKHVRT